MSTDSSILALVDAEFEVVHRPEHFTNFSHCCECAEHDNLLQSRTRETLKLEDVSNPGWDPLCFSSPEGVAYFFPSLARFALAEPDSQSGWYGEQLLFHLSSGFKDNNFFRYCSPRQRRAVSIFLGHIIESRAALVEAYAATDQFLRCHELWSDAQCSAPADAPTTGPSLS